MPNLSPRPRQRCPPRAVPLAPKPIKPSAAPEPTTDYVKTLQDNRHLDFVDRVLRPEKYPVIHNEDGSVSTHRMASAEFDGKPVVYPEIVRKPGEDTLTHLSRDEAAQHAKETGEYITLPTNEDALKFGSTGYKEAATQLRKQTSAAPPGDYSLAPAPAPAPTPQPGIPPAPGGEDKPLYVKAWEGANGLLANIEKPVIDVFHGVAKGLDDLIARGGLLANGEWKAALMGDDKPVPEYLSQITGAVPKAFGVEEAAQASSPASKFVGGLLGGLVAYMIPGGASAKFAKATETAPLAQKFISNLLTFSTTDTLSAAGRGESPEQVRAAFVKAIPTAALFTVAQALPFDKIANNPWMRKALESTATGTAFAGSHALGGETDPTGPGHQFPYWLCSSWGAKHPYGRITAKTERRA